ncbi:MAG: YitT family protein [Lachnospiraceae bacterium]|nr:YitT family protein [Lachnospiraceae bacterium]
MQRFITKKSKLRDYILIIAGTGILAFAIQCMFDPIGLVTGGFTGLAIIVKDMTQGIIPGGMPLWLTNILLNVPVFLLAYKVKGKAFIFRTAIGTFLLSAWLYVIPVIDLSHGDYFLASIFGGALAGLGIGLILLSKSTTGGTDMVATIIQHYVKHYSIVQILQILDGLIVLVGLYVFGLYAGLYSIIAIIVSTKVSDTVMEGFKFSKAAFIITDKHEIIAKRILTDLDRGVTGLYAKGMYSGTDKCMLYCVVSQKEIVAVKELVAEVDPHAFVIVSDAREVFGEGFLEYTHGE